LGKNGVFGGLVIGIDFVFVSAWGQNMTLLKN